MRLCLAALLLLAHAAFAQDVEIQRELVRRDQQSDAFKLQLQQSQERLLAPPGDARRRHETESRQLGERQRLEATSERQMQDIGRETPPALRPLERDRMQQERRPLAEPVLTPAIVTPEAPRTLPFNPEVGHPGKDVEWVPTPQELVDRMLEMAELTAADYLIDLGSGDGRTVITAARRGARALGVEFNPDMVALARRNAAAAAVGERAAFVQGDIFETDFSTASVVAMFLLPELNLRLRPRILALKPGTRIVSTNFMMGDWQPDRSVDIACDTYCVAHLWIVPARVDGVWRSPKGELRLTQRFQNLTGTLASGSGTLPITHGRMRGQEIRFSAGGADYRGRVLGDAIEGTVRTDTGASTWKAAR